MEQRKCRRCGHPMTRIITQTIEPGGSRWKACYTCLSCGHKIVAAPAGSRAEAEKGLEDFAAMIDQEYKTADTRSAAPRKPQTAEADRALAAYGLYCQLCEALTGKPIAKLDEMLEAAEQLKHRAEPEMRPLTLEEVRAHCAKGPDAEPLWAEFREEWRCWPRKPSPEQMAVAEWEE